MTRPRWPWTFAVEFPGGLVLDFSGTVLISTIGCGVVAAGAVAPLSAAGGGALATRACGAGSCSEGSAAAEMRASSRLSCGGRLVSGTTCSTTVIKPRGRGTAGERSTQTSTPQIKATQAPPTTMAANDKRSRCVRAINPTQKTYGAKIRGRVLTRSQYNAAPRRLRYANSDSGSTPAAPM